MPLILIGTATTVAEETRFKSTTALYSRRRPRVFIDICVHLHHHRVSIVQLHHMWIQIDGNGNRNTHTHTNQFDNEIVKVNGRQLVEGVLIMASLSHTHCVRTIDMKCRYIGHCCSRACVTFNTEILVQTTREPSTRSNLLKFIWSVGAPFRRIAFIDMTVACTSNIQHLRTNNTVVKRHSHSHSIWFWLFSSRHPSCVCAGACGGGYWNFEFDFFRVDTIVEQTNVHFVVSLFDYSKIPILSMPQSPTFTFSICSSWVYL